MKYISHRGNINGKNINKENSPEYIDIAIESYYDVEIDIWYIDNILYLGHDEPSNKIEFRWLRDRISKLWIHCKNLESLYYLKSSGYKLNYFWHQNDSFTLTSDEYIWTYPGEKLTRSSICVLPEIVNYTDDELKQCAGICSDVIEKYKLTINISNK